jgi:hypothetical protein
LEGRRRTTPVREPRRLDPSDGGAYIVPLSPARRIVQTGDLITERGYREE